MSLKNLTKKEKKVVTECLQAAAKGPFFDNDDFHILFGMDREEMLAIVAKLPKLDDSDELNRRAINNSINNLIGFPHKKGRYWKNYISVSQAELKRIFMKWKTGCGPQ